MLADMSAPNGETVPQGPNSPSGESSINRYTSLWPARTAAVCIHAVSPLNTHAALTHCALLSLCVKLLLMKRNTFTIKAANGSMDCCVTVIQCLKGVFSIRKFTWGM